tara:strand:- start:114 stop:452 length:339 start_codon:yes stop_codon:yes gene_type:complete
VPLINLRVSLAEIDAASDLLKELSSSLSEQTGKSEAYVMTLLETSVPMMFGGTSEPCAYIEIKSIGSLNPPEMSANFCKLIEARTGIPSNRIYVEFADVQGSLWGWNGRTFG